LSFFFTSPATTELYTLSLHDALPILHHDARVFVVIEPGALQLFVVEGEAERAHEVQARAGVRREPDDVAGVRRDFGLDQDDVNQDRKSTRLNSSHVSISYAVFCLKKK